MAQGNQTKAERRQSRAGAGTKADRKQARAGGGETKAERKRARAGRKGASAPATAESPAEDASAEERIEWRLARIEEAVAAQSQRSEELLERVNALLEETASGEA